MPTQCTSESFVFSSVEDRRVVAGFDGGVVASDAGAFICWEQWIGRLVRPIALRRASWMVGSGVVWCSRREGAGGTADVRSRVGP